MLSALARLAPVLTVLAVVLVAVGCGKESTAGSSSDPSSSSSSSSSSSGTSTGEQAAKPAGPALISMKQISFSPLVTHVNVGQSVKWTNEDNVDHNVKADSGAKFQSKSFGMGGTYTFVPKKPGEIKYECTIHPGMTGTLEVK